MSPPAALKPCLQAELTVVGILNTQTEARVLPYLLAALTALPPATMLFLLLFNTPDPRVMV